MPEIHGYTSDEHLFVFTRSSILAMAFCLAAAPFLAPALHAKQKNHAHHHRNHFVCAKGYHYEGDGVCRKNGDWWKHARPGQWGPAYMPSPRGDVVIDRPNGSGVNISW